MNAEGPAVNKHHIIDSSLGALHLQWSIPERCHTQPQVRNFQDFYTSTTYLPYLLLLHSTGVLHYHWLHVNPVYGSLRWRLRQERSRTLDFFRKPNQQPVDCC